MPSPLGHSLASLAIGWAVARPAPGRQLWIQAVALVALGNAPDLDLLFGRHSAETHSVGAAVIAASVAALARWPIDSRPGVIWLTAFLVWASHPLLDSLGQDTRAPIGVMAFWPISSSYFSWNVELFMPISRRYWLSGFIARNFLAMLREAAILGPFTAGVWWWRRRARAGSHAR
jgi:inner membrane protein